MGNTSTTTALNHLRTHPCAVPGRQRWATKELSQFSITTTWMEMEMELETENRGQAIIHDAVSASYTYTRLTPIYNMQNIRQGRTKNSCLKI